MILETVKDLIDEYKRRMAARMVRCENCDIEVARHDGYRMHQINCGHQAVFVPGTDYDQLPAGWTEATCQCGTVFPAIRFEDVEYPCKACDEKKKK